MVALIDYGAGNLFSVQNALDHLGAKWKVALRPEELADADSLILPGVGAFPHAMGELEKTGFASYLRENAENKPLLGICLGMQLLFSWGYEFEKCRGLNLIPGEIRRLHGGVLKIPHMGWNSLTVQNPCALTSQIADGEYVYFVHSYGAQTPDEFVSCYTEYGDRVPALVCRGHIYGAQFHPEKSGNTGLKILREFIGLTEGRT